MKELSVLIFALFVFSAYCQTKTEKVYSMLLENITDTLIELNNELEVISVGDKQPFHVAAVNKLFESNVPIKLTSFKAFDTRTLKLSTSAILSFDSVASLKHSTQKMVLTNKYTRKFQFFMHCKDATSADIVSLSNLDNALQHKYFLIEQECCFWLTTFVWYSSEHCNVPQLVLVNTFKKSDGTWQTDNFNIEKFRDFHGCVLNFMFIKSTSYMVLEVNHDKKTIKCEGYYCRAAKAISTSLNFKYTSNYRINQLNSTPVFGTNDVDLFWIFSTLGTISNEVYASVQKHNAKWFVSYPFMFDEEYFIVPPGEELTAYERLVMPFDYYTWIWIAATFFVSFSTILILKLTRVEIRNCVFGTNTQMPALNVLKTFLGNAVEKCPKRNFARILLMTFVLYSLVIRTAYEGKMFEFLQKEMRKATVQSVDEMIAKNFTFFMRRGYSRVNKDSDLFNRVSRSKIVETTSAQDYIDKVELLQNPNVKAGLQMSRENFAIYINVKQKQITQNRIKEKILSEMRIMPVPMHVKFFDEFDRKFQQLFEAGMFNFYDREIFEDPKKFEKHSEPNKILTLKELEASFVISVGLLVLAIVAFIIEWIVTLKDLWIFQRIFKALFDITTN